ncbi:MAG: adenylosuccinate lyase [Candidatus Coatesbacteria bacterium]|nr:MAG: adenylosuccinate lyase [Candidatus Coatesbacteria bacterium]
MIERYTLPAMAEVWSREYRFQRWLDVELAVCRASAKRGRVPKDALKEIEAKADFSIERIDEIEADVKHEVIAFLSAVAENVGPSSCYIHLGLTSSDVMDTASSLQMVAAMDLILAELDKVIAAAAELARKYRNLPAMGRTHGVHAEPTVFGLRFVIFYLELKRDKKRLERARAAVAVGKISGAVGNYSTLEPEVEEEALAELGLEPEPVSNQVVQRDRYAEYVNALAVCGATLEKIALEIRHLQRTEVAEAREPFAAGQKGSSVMPHKRNPELTERICGLARLLRGYAVVALENVALWHERDISHSSAERVIMPDATAALYYMLDKAAYVLGGLVVDEGRVRANVDMLKGLAFSGRVLNALAEAGMTREDAYEVVQAAAFAVHGAKEPDFRTALLKDEKAVETLGADGIEKYFDLKPYLKAASYLYGRAGL